MGPVSELNEVETVEEGGVLLSEMMEVLDDSLVVGGRIEVVERVPVVLASDERLLERHVEVLLRSEMVASVTLPGGRRGHGLTTEEVVGGSVVEDVESLLVSVEVKRDSREEDGRDEGSEKRLVRSVLESSPPEDVEVSDSAEGEEEEEGGDDQRRRSKRGGREGRRTINSLHVSNVERSRRRVEEVVVDDHLVVGGDEVDVDIVGNGQISVHAEESSESSVDRVVECDSVETVRSEISHEVLLIRGFRGNGDVVSLRSLRLDSTSATERRRRGNEEASGRERRDDEARTKSLLEV